MKQNVLILLSDQHTARALGCYGNEQVHTPNLDRLADRGVRFDAAYTTCPVCVPGRFALYTGRHVHSVETVRYPAATGRTSVDYGPAALSLRERTIAHHFRDAGYITGFIGKYHPVAPHTGGFDYLIDFGHYADYLGPRYETFTRGMGAVDSGCGVPWIDVFQEVIGTPWNGAPLTQGVPAVFDAEEDHPEDFVARETVRFLRAYRDEPFCVVASFLRPHAPWAAAPRFQAMYSPDEILPPPEPSVPPGEDTRLPAPVRAIGKRFWQPHETWPLPPPGDPARPTAARRWLAAYYACVSQMDAAVGKVLAALDELGLAEQTLVLYTSDHGEMAGEHGLYQKFVFYEGSARVPLLVRCPWIRQTPAVARAPVDLVDVVPTCLDLCCLPAAPAAKRIRLEGTSLAPLLREPNLQEPPGKGFAFSEMQYAGGPAYMARAGEWKYVHYTGTNERSLFNLAIDPDENENVAGTQRVIVEEDQLRRLLLEWLPGDQPQ